MSDDIRAAAERVRRWSNGGESQRVVYDFTDEVMDDFNYRMLENCATRDLKLLAAAYLAEHPADDDEPVDMDWFNSVGFAIEIDLFAVRGILSFFRNSKGWNVTVVNSVPVNRGDMTRGDVRRLCAALGVELEGTTPLREGLSK